MPALGKGKKKQSVSRSMPSLVTRPKKPSLETCWRTGKHMSPNHHSIKKVYNNWTKICNLGVSLWHSCFVYVQASQLIVAYDEHEVNNTFKFGVIHQKFGQVKYQIIWINTFTIYHNAIWSIICLLCFFCLCFSHHTTFGSLRLRHSPS